MQSETRTVVVGVGNDFRRDDGIGWAVVETLRSRASVEPLASGTELRICGGDPVRLIEWWENADLAVVIDAARVQPGHPGRVHRMELGSRQPARSATASSHGFGLGEAWGLAQVLGRLPHRLVIYAVEVADASVGRGLSPMVAAAVESVADSVISEIVRHREGPVPD
ncbi:MULTISPECIES: hydrogenase maturation protease [unclassified Streptomyces]|uniref:hydrogenase maturation protease n=1 Tax=unclassified Streptomyces TaxID=2593676 RepID=UPI002DD97415|nr:hydrogenase maturation protease [Streptomyces sp. NBC_01750]WSB04424.1 hydrogenase maturation protease [Streptomyces sp. NBC_01794]WSD31295.1 hydrogenase maturation protease [Streptomyces sp. NBC_01750]